MQDFTGNNNCLPYSSEVKRSLEIPRKAVSDILIEKMVDKIQEKIIKRNLNQKVKSSLTDDSSLSQQKSVPKVQVMRLRPKKPNIFTQSSPPRRSGLRLSNTLQIPEYQKNYSAELEQIWKQDDQKMMLNRYIQGQPIKQIKKQFQLMYPESERIFNAKTIRLKFNRTLRTILLYFESLTKKLEDNKLPQLQRLDNLRIKSIMTDRFALACRIKVLEVYLSDNVTSTLVREAIATINKYFHKKDEQE